MIDINITQYFCIELEKGYCEIIRELYNNENILITLNNEEGEINVYKNTLKAGEISSKITENKKKTLLIIWQIC